MMMGEIYRKIVVIEGPRAHQISTTLHPPPKSDGSPVPSNPIVDNRVTYTGTGGTDGLSHISQRVETVHTQE